MKAKNINTVLLIALILTSCAPAVTVVSPTKTAVPLPTFSPIPPTATIIPTPVPENPAATDVPTGLLSAEGAWLLYVHNYPQPGMMDIPDVPVEFILLNQDGSGRTPIVLSACSDGKVNNFLSDGQISGNYLAQYAGELYLFRPSQGTGMLVYGWTFLVSTCQTFFNRDETGGLLASMYQAADDASPELIIYELPGGKIRDRFPLVRCAKDDKVCEEFRSNWDQMSEQKPHWSPNGRYLAFAAVLDASTSDLFVYDSQDGGLRRLTDGPDWVGPIQWTPDGTQIIIQELINDGEFFFAPSSKPPSSVWSVSVSTNEIKFLYSTDDAITEQTIWWLDDKHFFAYEGFLLFADQATNLRFVDMEAGTNRILFDGQFVMESYDPIHETFALYELESEKYPQGIYLVSMKNNTVHYLESPPYVYNFPEWDSKTGLFVSGDDCENDSRSFLAFDYLGNFTCVPKPATTPTLALVETTRYPAPNGTSVVFVNEGTWLETQGKAAVQISGQAASDVIWCLNSSCFFFFMPEQGHKWSLYHVSIPDLTVKLVDEGIESLGSAQWLGGEK